MPNVPRSRAVQIREGYVERVFRNNGNIELTLREPCEEDLRTVLFPYDNLLEAQLTRGRYVVASYFSDNGDVRAHQITILEQGRVVAISRSLPLEDETVFVE